MSRRRLKKIMSVQSTTYMTKRVDLFIKEFFDELSKDDKENYSYMYEDGNTYITKGDAETYPCVVAHTDTVHDIHENFTVFSGNGVMFAMDMTKGLQVGIGGDDKVGIYVALEMLMHKDVIKVAFFRDEEYGCLGSREALMGWFHNVEFVLQCDRQGYKDFVKQIAGNILFDKDFSNEIAPTLSKWNKKETDDGGLTDVCQLVDNGLKVCSANISCGYYRPHSDDEILVLEDVFNTRDFVSELIDVLSGTVWHNSQYGVSPFGKYGRYGKYGGYDWGAEDYAIAYGNESNIPPDAPSDYHLSVDDVDLKDCCEECGGEEVYHDENEHMDWCFNCQDYTNDYTHLIVKKGVKSVHESN